MDHAHIYRKYIRMGYPGHQIDIGRSLCDGLSHQGGYLAAGLAHALGHHAVIGAENQRAALVNAYVRGILHPGDP